MDARLFLLILQCLIARIFSACCKNEHFCQTLLINNLEDTSSTLCKNVNEFLRCKMGVGLATDGEVKEMIERLMADVTFGGLGCDIDTELLSTLRLENKPANLMNVNVFKVDTEAGSVCLDTYLENIDSHVNFRSLVCQDINVFLKCVSDQRSAEDLDKAITLFNYVLEEYGLFCNLTRETVIMDCDVGAGKCLTSYFHKQSDGAFKDIHGSKCPYINDYLVCMVRTSCSIHTLQEGLKVLSSIEEQKSGYKCDIGLDTSASVTLRNKMATRLATVMMGPYQVALSETIRVFKHSAHKNTTK
ncbi:uncharacterized protein LOC131943890 isoform X2 [Physella acuta]|uniref:uncharacterized protein LOC131943890 isoform X2 n=1 Tax=Physella acuta TaxID=109671 RepID=UPI0027DD27A2|nr:uncharacterized protein LOC131943890 isoform X2 [Physella acuta]